MFVQKLTRAAHPIERNDTIKVEAGTLVVQCDEYFKGGACNMITLRVTENNEISLNMVINPPHASEQPLRHTAGEELNAPLAHHIRKTAMPLISNPHQGLDTGIDLMIAAAIQNLTMRPVLTLVN